MDGRTWRHQEESWGDRVLIASSPQLGNGEILSEIDEEKVEI